MSKAERVSQAEKATIGLRSLIMEGAFHPNTRLREVALAERLGTSRTPLRQAMDTLVAEGLLERVESGGCRVTSLDIDDICDSIELRGVIEGTAARLAAERGADPELLAQGEALLEGLDRSVAEPANIDFPTYVRLNGKFHNLLAKLPGSAVIQRELERVNRLPLASPTAFLREQDLVPDFMRSLIRAQGQHRAILEAIRDGEGTRAESVAREHARLARNNFAFLTKAEPHLATRIPGLALVTSE
jgi:GntR family transcriptional regulator of vanillate catabolism